MTGIVSKRRLNVRPVQPGSTANKQDLPKQTWRVEIVRLGTTAQEERRVISQLQVPDKVGQGVIYHHVGFK